MSSVRIILILLINQISAAVFHNHCDSLSAVDLQAATYHHSHILRVQPVYSSEEAVQTLAARKVLLREVIKIPSTSSPAMQANAIILVRTEHNLDDPCWQLLQMEQADIILFLNGTTTKEFDLHFPPVESTLRVRENMQAVMNYETYSPQVIIKTRMGKPIVANDYSLQCNARGNPIPRLFWTQNNQSSEFYPSAKQCTTSCRIYSVQNDYQSILHFRSLTASDSGIYVCHAENLLDRTTASVYLDIEEGKRVGRPPMNLTCDSVTFCHDRGQCLIVDNQPKCVCDSRYFGEQCETSYDEILTKQNDAFLLFKSRFLTGTILILVILTLTFIALVSCLLAKYNQTKRKQIFRATSMDDNSKPKSDATEQRIRVERQQTLSLPLTHVVNHRADCKHNASAMAGQEKTSTGYGQGHSSLTINQLNDANFESKTNHLILSEDYLEFYQPDAESGLIRPLTIPLEMPKRHAQDASSQNRFLLPRPVHQR